MKKIFLMAVACCLMIGGANAISFESGTILEDGFVKLSEGQTMIVSASLENEVADSHDAYVSNVDEDLSKATGIASVALRRIHGYPMVVEAETGNVYYHPSIGSGVRFSPTPQWGSLSLTTSQTKGLYQKILQYVQNSGPTGYHYSIVGWYIEADFQTRADYPRYITFSSVNPVFSIDGQEKKETIPYMTTNFTLKGASRLPENASAEEYYHIDGIKGSFTYRTAFSNQIRSIPFSAGISLNSNM